MDPATPLTRLEYQISQQFAAMNANLEHIMQRLGIPLQQQPLPVQSWHQKSTSPAPPAPQKAQRQKDKQPLQQQSTQHSTPPAPQEAQKEVEQVKMQPLYQATVEDDTESTTKHGSSMPDSKSILSSMPCLCAARSSGDSAACLSNALLASFLTSFFGDFLTSFFALASFLAWHGLLPGYIECMEGMEATGQG